MAATTTGTTSPRRTTNEILKRKMGAAERLQQETDVSKKMKTYEVSVLTPYVTYTIKARTKKEAIEKCPTPDYIDFCDGPIQYVAEEIEEDEDAETET